MGYPFPHMMPPHCFPGFGEFGPRRHRFGKGKAMKFFRKFMEAFKESSSSSSDSSSAERKEKRKEKQNQKQKQNCAKRQEYKNKRPQVLEKPSEIKESISTSNKENSEISTSISIKIQNTSPWPFMLTGVRKTGGDDTIKFEDFKYNERLFKEKIIDLKIPVTLPSIVGEYSATFGFLNKNSKISGEEFTVKFIISE